jgi:hypothetical protein
MITRIVAVCALLWLLLAPLLLAQQASVTGRVVDKGGGLVGARFTF